jgi:mono/diheme cytochrome c family protein
MTHCFARALMTSTLLLSACGAEPAPLREWRPDDHGEPSQLAGQAEAESPSAAAQPDAPGGQARAAEALFNVSCASCHGRDGKGGGPGMPPGAQVPDFSAPEFQASRTDEALAQVIRDGRGMMPPFGKQVTAEGLTVLVAHLRSLAANTKPSTAVE